MSTEEKEVLMTAKQYEESFKTKCEESTQEFFKLVLKDIIGKVKKASNVTPMSRSIKGERFKVNSAVHLELLGNLVGNALKGTGWDCEISVDPQPMDEKLIQICLKLPVLKPMSFEDFILMATEEIRNNHKL